MTSTALRGGYAHGSIVDELGGRGGFALVAWVASVAWRSYQPRGFVTLERDPASPWGAAPWRLSFEEYVLEPATAERPGVWCVCYHPHGECLACGCPLLAGSP